MLKRIVLAMILMLCAASFTVEAAPWGRQNTVKQSTKAAAIESFFQAVINKDINAIWQLCSPQAKKQAIDQYGSVAAAQKSLQKEIFSEIDEKSDDFKMMKEMMKSDYLREKFVKEMLADKEFVKDMVQINGKWYFKFEDDEEQKIDQSSKNAVAKSVIYAIINKDENMLWELLVPAIREEAVKQFGSNQAKTKIMQAILGEVTAKDIADMKQAMQENEKEAIKNFIQGAGDASFVKINGKWYFGATE